MLLEARNVSKIYGQNTACSNICLSLMEGQVFGLLGPNGAGKTTLVKIFLGLVHPTSGQVYIRGKTIDDFLSKRNMGYLPELFRLYEWLSAQEYLAFNARLYDIPARQVKNAVEQALQLVGLKGRGKEKISGYSKGMQQRLALAAAVVHKPALVFLDEPTSALDPVGRREVRDIINRLTEHKTTVFLNSHLLSEVEVTCTHLGFIKQGELIAQGEVKEFMKGSQEIVIETDDADEELLLEWRQAGKLLDHDDKKVVFKANHEEIPEIIARLVEKGARIYRVEANNQGLEEVFLDLMKE